MATGTGTPPHNHIAPPRARPTLDLPLDAMSTQQQAYGYSLTRVLDKKRDESVLRLLVELPGVVSVQEIDLQFSELFTKRVLHLDVTTDARGTLVIDLPEPVLLEPRAKFLKKTRQLRVDLVPATAPAEAQAASAKESASAKAREDAARVEAAAAEAAGRTHPSHPSPIDRAAPPTKGP